MFEKKLMMTGIKKQRQILDDMMISLRSRMYLTHGDCQMFQRNLKQVEINLRKLRKLRQDCVECHENEN